LEAISKGQAIEISRGSDHIGRATSDCKWPLQLIYHDIAWYLIYEYCNNEHLAVGRVNPSRTTAKFSLAIAV